GQVRGHERRVVQVEVFRRMVSVRTSILEDLDAYPRTSRRSRATPSTAKSQFVALVDYLEDGHERERIEARIGEAFSEVRVELLLGLRRRLQGSLPKGLVDALWARL
ncbi:MAG: hypothetical protein J0J00_02885, partial [Microbacterium sp.]|nr:hypothetical protein [Microbacterium sp.]MBN9209504.1 hypothetical protein [Microbacterium ginsengisoli]